MSGTDQERGVSKGLAAADLLLATAALLLFLAAVNTDGFGGWALLASAIACHIARLVGGLSASRWPSTLGLAESASALSDRPVGSWLNWAYVALLVGISGIGARLG